MLGIRYPDEVNLAGNSAATLKALIPQLATKRTRAGGRGSRAGSQSATSPGSSARW
jgi:hypothetical protein